MAGLFGKLFAGKRWDDQLKAAGSTALKLDIVDKALASGNLLTNKSTEFKALSTMFRSVLDTEKSITAEKLALEKETQKALNAPELSAGRNRLLDRTRGGFMSTILGGRSMLGG